MQQCPNCGHSNRAGVVFCENCGSSLIGKMPLDTKSLSGSGEADPEQYGVDSSVLTDVKVQGLATFKPGDRLRIELEGAAEPIVITPMTEAIFGRRDPATGALPDIDLTPYAGYRMGVSRRHATIRLNDENSLDVWDLGSSNGTFLNGQRLSAHRPYRLHDGDELRLGQMMMRITFESAKEPAAEPAPTAPLPPIEAPAPAAAPQIITEPIVPPAVIELPAPPPVAEPVAAPAAATSPAPATEGAPAAVAAEAPAPAEAPVAEAPAPVAPPAPAPESPTEPARTMAISVPPAQAVIAPEAKPSALEPVSSAAPEATTAQAPAEAQPPAAADAATGAPAPAPETSAPAAAEQPNDEKRD